MLPEGLYLGPDMNKLIMTGGYRDDPFGTIVKFAQVLGFGCAIRTQNNAMQSLVAEASKWLAPTIAHYADGEVRISMDPILSCDKGNRLIASSKYKLGTVDGPLTGADMLHIEFRETGLYLPESTS